MVVADVRTPTAAAGSALLALPPLELHQQKRPAPPTSLLLLSGGSGASTQDRVTVFESEGNVCRSRGDGGQGGGGGGGGGARKEEEPAAAEQEEGSFPPLQQQQQQQQQQHSRHTKFDDDDDDDDQEKDEQKKEKMADDEQPGRKKKKRRRQRHLNDAEEEQAPPLSLLPAASAPPPPCRLDLSLTAATISAALRLSPEAENEKNNNRRKGGEASVAGSGGLFRPAPRGNYARYYGYRLGLHSSSSSVSPASPFSLPRHQLSPAHEALYGPGAADPRLRALLPYLGLLRGRSLLDVGCNGGVLTLAVAAAAGVSSAVGVDTDASLVRSARARCLRAREGAAAWEKGLRGAPGKGGGEEEEDERNPSSSTSSSSPSPSLPFLLPEPGGKSLAGRRAAARACLRALRATTFRHEDFVAVAAAAVAAAAASPAEGEVEGEGEGEGEEEEEEDGDEEQGPKGGGGAGEEEEQLFGAALCLSVTKWIHLAHGDPGIERLFLRLSRCLSRGAHLVLEPQPWRSYQRAVRKKGVRETLLLSSSCSSCSPPPASASASASAAAAAAASPAPRSLSSLRIRPEDFVSLLEEPRHGFTLVRSLGAPEGAAPGFDRPLLLFRKK